MQLCERRVGEARIIESDRSKLPEAVLCRVVYPICNIGQLNANNRLYEREVWEKVLHDEVIQEKMSTRTLFGQAEHPAETASDLQLTSHIVTNTWIDENDNRVYQEIDVLDTPTGRIVDCLLRANCQVGVSTRAEGDLEEMQLEEDKTCQRVVPESYSYVTTDFTADPSTFGVTPQVVKRNVLPTLKRSMECKNLKENERQYARQLYESITKPEKEDVDEGHTSLQVTTDDGTNVSVEADGDVDVSASAEGDVSVNPSVDVPPMAGVVEGEPEFGDMGMEPPVEEEPEVPEEEPEVVEPVEEPEEESDEEKNKPFESKIDESVWENMSVSELMETSTVLEDAEFKKCVDKGGRVRRVSGPDKDHGLKDDQYVNYCFSDGESYRGEVHTEEKETKEEMEESDVNEAHPDVEEYWKSELVANLNRRKERGETLEPEEEELLQRATESVSASGPREVRNLVIDLRVKEAEIRAERDSLAEALQGTRSTDVQVRILQERLQQAQDEVDGLRSILERKLRKSRKVLDESKKKEQRARKALVESTKEEGLQEGRQEVLEQYVSRRLAGSQIQVDGNTRALLSECQTLEEADDVLEQLVKVARRGALHPVGPIRAAVVQRTSNPEDKQIHDQIGGLLSQWS